MGAFIIKFAGLDQQQGKRKFNFVLLGKIKRLLITV